MADETPPVPAESPAGRTPHELAALRAELDRIDGELLEQLKARIECCVRIAHVKRTHAVPMMQPHRIGVVQERAARFADTHGIDREFMRQFYELIIAETCRVEDLVIGAPTR